MLSRVAERIYWMARYLERVESTARLLKVYANLLLDLPRKVNIGWYNLVVLNNNTALFDERYRNRDERNVVKFMLADADNTISMLSSLAMVRENVRTTRDVLPLETWESINELSLYAKNHIQEGINRRHRQEFLNEIIKGVQRINGLIDGAMARDASWEFVRLGSNLERADMTTRILDAGASAMMQTRDETDADIREILWGNILYSLSAYYPYRRSVRTSIVDSSVARYLLEDPQLPRAVECCLQQLIAGVTRLPRHEPVLLKLEQCSSMAFADRNYQDLTEPFRDHLNDLQLWLGDVHAAIEQNWFALDRDES